MTAVSGEVEGAGSQNRISVVLATYNGEKFLREQLLSLSSQTVPPRELIVSDDGSSDSTLDIIETYAVTAPFPVCIVKHAGPAGYANNFLSACEHATGKWIAFCDQDDIWHPEKIETCQRALSRPDALACAHTVKLIDAAGTQIGHFNQAISVRGKSIFQGPWYAYLGMSLAFDRQLLQILVNSDETRGLDPDTGKLGLGHDKWICFLAESLGSVALIPQPLASYRLHGANLSMSNDSLKRRTIQWSRLAGMPAVRGLRRVTIARYRHLLLKAIAQKDETEASRSKLGGEARRWKAVAQHEGLRLKCYQTPGMSKRFGLLSKLIMQGAYRPADNGGLGGLVVMKDLLIGVLRLRRVKV